jgi:cephalosporin hydroxylase
MTSRQVAREAVYRKSAYQKPRELARLLRLTRDDPPRVVVEIGSAEGGTLWALCRAARADALVISIDLPGGAFGGGYSEQAVSRLRGYRRARQTMHFLRTDSHRPQTLIELKSILAGRQVDLLMIDGDHTETGVAQDFAMYAPLVRRGGIVAVHDIVTHPVASGCEVDRFWRSLPEPRPSLSMSATTNAGGAHGRGSASFGRSRPDQHLPEVSSARGRDPRHGWYGRLWSRRAAWIG